MPEETVLDATADDLIGGKRLRTTEFQITTLDERGDEVVRNAKAQAIPAEEYDQLLAAHPPTPDQKKKGDAYNTDTFAPALISACMITPALSLDQAHALWKSTQWSKGELLDLFLTCARVCQAGLDVPFNSVG